MRNQSVILKILFTLNIQTASLLELPPSLTTDCSALLMSLQRKEKMCSGFLFFSPEMFLIVQLGGLNIQDKSAFGAFYITVHNLWFCIYLQV